MCRRSRSRPTAPPIAQAISSCVAGIVVELVTLIRIALPRSRFIIVAKPSRASVSPP